jgi:multisubunit Na+/H+ antiporter MnhE subunit
MIEYRLAWLGWWGGFTSVWLLLVDTSSTPEVLMGMAATVIAAAAAEVVRSRGLAPLHPRLQWLRSVCRLPGRVLLDCWIVIVALCRELVRSQPTRGVFRAVPFRAGGADAGSAAQRALVTMAISLTSNTYVIGIDRDANMILIHQLVRQPLASVRADSWWPR